MSIETQNKDNEAMAAPRIMPLLKSDIEDCVARLPTLLRSTTESQNLDVWIAGGFVRAVIAGEPINDVDVFGCRHEHMARIAEALELVPGKVHKSSSAITYTGIRPKVQLITRWRGQNPLECILSFDFSMSMAVIWWDASTSRWLGACHEDFYPDIASKTLRYFRPKERADAGGSLMRVVKFAKLGYSPDKRSLGQLLIHLIECIDVGKCLADGDEGAKIIEALLQSNYGEENP